MCIVTVAVRLYNDARADVEEVDANALVDTRAMNLCVPEHVALQLRLEKRAEREVVLADGSRRLVPYASGVRVETQGRVCVTGALVLGDRVLLGAIPVEDMDMIVEPARLTAISNPANPNIAVSLAMGLATVGSAEGKVSR